MVSIPIYADRHGVMCKAWRGNEEEKFLKNDVEHERLLFVVQSLFTLKGVDMG